MRSGHCASAAADVASLLETEILVVGLYNFLGMDLKVGRKDVRIEHSQTDFNH
jgi:hypothetical protein